MIVEQLGVYSNELQNLGTASPVADAQRVSENLRPSQEREKKEIEEQIAEEARCLDDFKTRYQDLTDNL